jgi:ParB family chromosome partitioning protein
MEELQQFGKQTDSTKELHLNPMLENGAKLNAAIADGKQDNGAVIIQVEAIVAEEQVRKHFDDGEIRKLADSFEVLGQQQAITVYYDNDISRFVIIHGERRVRAAKLLGWSTIRAWVREEKPSESDRIELQLAENIARRDLNEIEIGKALAQLKELRGYSTRELAVRVGKSQTTVIRLLSILALPEELKAHVANGTLPGSVAYEIGKLPERSQQRQAAKRYLRGQLTRAGVEEVSGRLKSKSAAKGNKGCSRKAFPHNPWPVKLDGGNGLRVWVKPSRNNGDEAWTFEHVKQALEEAVAEVSAWVEGQVRLI